MPEVDSDDEEYLPTADLDDQVWSEGPVPDSWEYLCIHENTKASNPTPASPSWEECQQPPPLQPNQVKMPATPPQQPDQVEMDIPDPHDCS